MNINTWEREKLHQLLDAMIDENEDTALISFASLDNGVKQLRLTLKEEVWQTMKS